ncbi:exonuclease SbcCD subunit D, partial [Propionibacterium sp.]|uniref:metallophosphoesterase family protein n=1 Tax=Propionibacterium sp. TaxID=1977903 RepID=UPI00345EE474
MRILHTSDWHLGRTLRGVDLSDAHAAFLDQLVAVARSERADAVLVSGDVFDRALPPLDAVNMLNDALARLTEVAPVVLIPGNHDSPQRLGLNAKLLRDQLHIRATLADIAHPVVLPDSTGHDGLVVYAILYLDPDMTRDRLGELAGVDGDGRIARSHEAVVGAALSMVHRDLARRRAANGTRIPAAVMAHAFVTGAQPSDSERDLRIGGVDSVPAALFADVGTDYVALGHLHGAQAVAGSRDPASDHDEGAVMRYAGSPLAFSFSEQHQHKSTALVTF